MKIRNIKLHKIICNFIKEVKGLRDTQGVDYLDISKKYISSISDSFELGLDFISYCQSLAFFEPILYQTKGYRSHFVHQLNVFLNGYLILSWLNDNQFRFIKDVINKKCNNFSIDSVDIFKIWFLIAMYHDTGYPLGKVGDWMKNFLEHIFQREFNHIPDAVVEPLSFRLYRESFCNSINLLIQFLFDWLEIKENQKNKFGHIIRELFFQNLNENIIAGLILIKASEKLGLKNNILSPAVSAIVLDDENIWSILRDEKIKEKMFYSDHPLAFLLIYSDNIQEYGRLKGEKGNIPKIDPTAITKQELEFGNNNDSVHCNLTYPKKPEIWEAKICSILKNIKDFWRSPCDIEFKISYTTKTDGEFDVLPFLKGNTKSY